MTAPARRPGRRPRRLPLRGAALLAVPALLALAPGARAAPYVVVGCADPAGLGQPGQVVRATDGWVPDGVADPGGDGCARGAAGRGLLAYSSGPFAGYELSAPPGTKLAGFWAWYAAHLPQPWAGAGAQLAFEARFGEDWRAVPPTVSWLAPATLDLGGAWAHTDLAGADGLRLGVRCLGGPCSPTDLPRVEVHSVGVAVDDPSPPALAPLAGSLLAAGVQRGARALLVGASDQGGGAASLTTSVGGRVVDSWTGCASLGTQFSDAPHYDRRVPCPPAVSRSVAVATATLPDGPEPVEIRATDAAGNVQSASAEVVLDNHPPAPGAVSIAGIARSGERLQAVVSGFAGQDPSLVLTWQRCDGAGSCRSLPAHQDSYLLGPGDVGRHVRVRATATDGGGTAVAYSAETDVVAPAATPPPAPAPSHVPNGRHADARAHVSAWLLDARGRHLTRITGRPGARVRVGGAVLGVHARPVTGASLTVVADDGTVAPARTGAGGRFAGSIRLPRAATLRVTYLPFSDSRRAVRSRALRFTVRR